MAYETLDPGGDDIVRFVFKPVGAGSNAAHLIAVRADDETNQRWRETGSVSCSTIVYHSDTIEKLPDGRQTVRPYAYYREPPDYDKIRSTVAGILTGEAKPLSGEPDPYWTGGP